MTDRIRLLQALRDAGSTGVHSHDLRRAGISGNPSQRIRELRLEGHVIEGEPERRNGRPGKRWTLTHDAAIGAGNDNNPDSFVASVDRGAGVGGAVHSHRSEDQAYRGDPSDPGAPPRPAAVTPAAAAGQLFEVPEQPTEAALHDWDEEAA